MLDKSQKRKFNNMKIIIMIVVAIIMLIIITIIIRYLLYVKCYKNNAKEYAVTIIDDKSFLSGFEVMNNEVHIQCVVSLKNNSSDIKRVKLLGSFQKEVENGLLKEKELEAYFMESASNSVTIKGNSIMKYIEIEFVGEYAGNSSMRNRLLPYIEIIEVD